MATEEFVVLDFGTDGPVLENCDTYKLIGLDSATPFIEIGGRIFQGEHVTALGTDIVYGKGDGDIPTVVATTRKRIRFTRVELTLKEPKDS